MEYYLYCFFFKLLSSFAYRFFYFGFHPVLNQVNQVFANLTKSNYKEVDPFVSDSFIIKLISEPGFYILILPFVIGMQLTCRLKWNNIEFGKELRLFIIAIAGIACFTAVFYGYNFYYNQSHFFDRIVLLLLFISIIFRPVFLYPFTFLIFVSWSQGNYPINNNSITDEKLSFDFLLVSCVFLSFIVKLKTKSSYFLIFCGSIFASSYFYSGLKKIFLSPSGYEWIFQNELWVGLYNMKLFGWDPIFFAISSDILFSSIKSYGFIIGLFAVLLEIATVFLFDKRKISLFLLISMITFLSIVLLLWGLFFIKWAVISLLFICIFYTSNIKLQHSLFNTRVLILSVFLIITSKVYYHPAELSWWETRLSNRFKFLVKGESGRIYEVPANQMAPFDKSFGFNRLCFLFNRPFKVVGDGTADFQLQNFLKMHHPNEAFLNKYDVNYYRPDKLKIFEHFINKYYSNIN